MIDWSVYIGIPWVAGAQGPDAFDCWSFFRAVQKEHFGRDLPHVEVDANNIHEVVRGFNEPDNRTMWTEITQSEVKEGDAVLMSQSRYPSHVGLWISNGGVLHCVHGMGVVFSDITALKRSGWGRLRFYRYTGQ